MSASQPELEDSTDGGESEAFPELLDEMEMKEGRLVTTTFRKRPLRPLRHSGCREGSSEARMAM